MLAHSPKTLALLVINQRKKLKLSQAEVGKRVGLKQQTISEFEIKPEGTKITTLFLILSAVELDMTLSPKNEPRQTQKTWNEEW